MIAGLRIAGLLGVVLTGLSAAAGSAPHTEPVPATELRLVRPVQSAPDGTAAVIDRDVYRSLIDRREFVLSGFPLPNRDAVTLELTGFDLLKTDSRLVVVDAAGERQVAHPDFRAFRGSVVGDAGSLVTLSLFGGRVAGSVRTGGEEYVVVPESFDPAGPHETTVKVRHQSADTDRPTGPLCPTGVEHPVIAPISGETDVASDTQGIDGSTMLRAQIAIDATYAWFNHFDSLAAAQSYILNIMAQVSTIYEDEVRVELEVSHLRVFTTPDDPYGNTTNTSTLLQNLRSEWNANQTEVDRTVVHLFSVRPGGGAGVAYLDVLCNNTFQPGNSYDYGVSTLSANGGSWEKGLVAHELGHNFSSPHTHCYSPEIDRCANEPGCYGGQTVASVGTIMSYCSQTVPSFHPRVEDERIRPAAEAAYGTCLTTVVPPAPPAAPQDVTVF
jgi:hypothetical protein